MRLIIMHPFTSPKAMPPSFLSMLHLAIIALLISLKTPHISSQSLSISTDKQALLSLKSQIDTESQSLLSEWDQILSPCNWTGVSCDQDGERVIGLNLSGMSLKGTISPSLGNLSFLKSLELQNNQFTGSLPNEISNLFRLRLLNTSFNAIQGALPQNLSLWVKLKALDLMQNQFYGTIPEDITCFKNLQVLNLARNNFSGTIPPSLSNISSLVELNFGTNSLTGQIPANLARLPSLEILDLTINNLNGTVPREIYNMSSMVKLALASNDFWGTIPSNVGTTLPNLLVFNFCFNKFTGGIPGSLNNLTDIQVIRMAHNLLNGPVPPELGNLPKLTMYNIGFNNIVSLGDNGLDLLTSLTNSTCLNFLAIDGNQLEGFIPESIGNLSKVLSKLYMGKNHIYGTIPRSIGRLSGLSLLNLGFNSISGMIPRELGQLQNLQELILAGNKLSGIIPPSLGDLSGLIQIDLSKNELIGNIPTSLGSFQKVLSMDLSHNRLNGIIPNEILNLPSLSNYLNLSNNLLSGTLSWEIGKLENIVTIEFSRNALFGPIPDSIGNCKSLERLLMANNVFSGQIPDTLEKLKGLEKLDISSNKLSGPIPDSLSKLQALQYLNLSFNDLEGQVPISDIFANVSEVYLEGNPKLCLHSKCGKGDDSRGNVILLLVLIPVGVVSLLCIAISLYFYRKKSKAKLINSSEFFERQHQYVSYDELRVATNDFSEEKLIGSGSFGSVYKGYLEVGKVVAIKVLNMDSKGSFKSFLAECTALKNLRHRNLVKLITTCSSIDFKNMEFLALVYDFMGNGSLEDWISGKRRNEKGNFLNVIERIDVGIDVACAVDYLHYGSFTQVVHCDIKPSNILLDEDMTAKVGDFGLAKLLIGRNSSDQFSLSSTNGLKGSIGYIPPEYGLGEKPSPAGDVYSFGITFLEIFTGKKPTDEIFSGGLSLRKWVEMNFPTNIEKVVDPNLLPNKGIHIQEGESITLGAQYQCFVSLLGLGLSCTTDSSDTRISMDNALIKLKSIRNTLIKSHPPHDFHEKERD